MSIVADILKSYRQPVQVARKRQSIGTEATALATLMGSALLIFVAQWPRLARDAHFDPSVPMDARIGGALLGILFIFPLAAYVFSGILFLFVRLFSKQVTGISMRLALFWSFLVVSPLWLVYGLLVGFLGAAPVIDVLGIMILAMFLIVLISSVKAAMDPDGLT